MSFADYGLDVFPTRQSSNLHNKNVGADLEEDTISNCRCQHEQVIEHLIELGSGTETELARARIELEKYRGVDKCLRVAEQQRKRGYLDRIIAAAVTGSWLSRARGYKGNDENTGGIESSGGTGDCCSLLCPDAIRTTIIQKDSEIISLKNEKAARETEVKELEEQNKKLETVVEKMKSDIELLESSSRFTKAQIQEIVRQKNDELEILRKNVEKLEHKVKDEREAKSSNEKEIAKLESLVRETHSLKKNLAGELETVKQRLETVQKERDQLDLQIREHENEIEKLLGIIQRVNEKYDKIKSELTNSRDEVNLLRNQLCASRDQLEATQREVSRLVADLSECMGRVAVDSDEAASGGGDSLDVYAAARQLARNLRDIVREHENCRQHKLQLIGQIKKLEHHEPVQSLQEIEAIKMNANQEIARLKRILVGADNYKTIKADLKGIMDELLMRIDQRTIEKSEQAYLRVADEASLALQKLDKKINEHEVYRRCESFLLLELENLQDALDGAEKTIHGIDSRKDGRELEIEPWCEHSEEEEEDCTIETGDHSVLDSKLTKKILQRVQNSTQIVVRITTALRDDSTLRMMYNKKLEDQLQQALSALNELGIEKCQLQSECEKLKNQSEVLATELDKTKSLLSMQSEEQQSLSKRFQEKSEEMRSLNKKLQEKSDELKSLNERLLEKSNELKSLNEQLQTRLESNRTEKESLRKQLASLESKYEDSLAEKSSLLSSRDEMIENLRKELQSRDAKLKEYGQFNDYLNSKLEESSRMIEQLQSTIVTESMRKVDFDSLGAMHARIMELVRFKDELHDKVGLLESQLSSQQRANGKLQMNLGKMMEENERLERCVRKFKSENETLQSSIAAAVKAVGDEEGDGGKTGQTGKERQFRVVQGKDVGVKCDQLVERIERISMASRQTLEGRQSGAGDSALRGLEKELRSQKDKLRYQQKELMMKEKEIQDKNAQIEALTIQLSKAKEFDSASLLKRIEILDNEKAELKNELKQTLMKYEDKLAEMHKQYEHNKIELHKNHDDSIRRLEAKYLDMMKDESKIINSQNILQSLSASEIQELHEKICKMSSISCPINAVSYEKDVYEEQKKRSAAKGIPPSHGLKKTTQQKKDTPTVKGLTSSFAAKPSSRQRPPTRTSLSSQSINVPEKEYSHGIGSARNESSSHRGKERH
ncbi:hypothetical protein QAD02_001116 [Eretmocerus hayati]|uniref:Uncharacterized protein n=1 Tax=Eretmocerus hayati TaxID=131215 RepID=A0ACC2NFB3_9HYME|nr:hypothetical protein QAD02_001116 [Eretmocerus hayati]